MRYQLVSTNLGAVRVATSPVFGAKFSRQAKHLQVSDSKKKLQENYPSIFFFKDSPIERKKILIH